MYNCHVHAFTSQAVPDGFLPLKLMRLLRTRLGSKMGRLFLRHLWPFGNTDLFDRLAAFISIGNLPSQKEIFEALKGFYPDGTRFVVLPLDMDGMEAGKAPQSYLHQLEELRHLKLQYPDFILPFVAVDPRRSGLLDLVKKYIEDYEFAGLKLYPPLGYFPCDPKLNRVYAYAEKHAIPVLTHCSRGGIYFKGKITREMRVHPRTGRCLKGKNNKDFTDHFSDPENYKYVLEDFPQLKLCLAHYGGAGEWQSWLRDPWTGTGRKSWLSVVSDLIRSHTNVFADLAYTAYDTRLLPLIKVLVNTPKLGDRILYGSDFYMVQRDVTEREYSINLRAFLGEEDFHKITVENPKAFLF